MHILNLALCLFVADSFPVRFFTLSLCPQFSNLYFNFQNASLNCQPKVRLASLVFSVTQTQILLILDLTALLPPRSRKLQSVDQSRRLKVGIYFYSWFYQHPETSWFSDISCYFHCCLNQNLMRNFLTVSIIQWRCAVSYLIKLPSFYYILSAYLKI